MRLQAVGANGWRGRRRSEGVAPMRAGSQEPRRKAAEALGLRLRAGAGGGEVEGDGGEAHEGGRGL